MAVSDKKRTFAIKKFLIDFGMPTTVPTTYNIANSYWNIVKHLSNDVKIDLITLLSQSLKSENSPHVSARKHYGVWGDDGSVIDEVASLVEERPTAI